MESVNSLALGIGQLVEDSRAFEFHPAMAPEESHSETSPLLGSQGNGNGNGNGSYAAIATATAPAPADDPAQIQDPALAESGIGSDAGKDGSRNTSLRYILPAISLGVCLPHTNYLPISLPNIEGC